MSESVSNVCRKNILIKRIGIVPEYEMKPVPFSINYNERVKTYCLDLIEQINRMYGPEPENVDIMYDKEGVYIAYYAKDSEWVDQVEVLEWDEYHYRG